MYPVYGFGAKVRTVFVVTYVLWDALCVSVFLVSACSV